VAILPHILTGDSNVAWTANAKIQREIFKAAQFLPKDQKPKIPSVRRKAEEQ
jgi:hypothetical protein